MLTGYKFTDTSYLCLEASVNSDVSLVVMSCLTSRWPALSIRSIVNTIPGSYHHDMGLGEIGIGPSLSAMDRLSSILRDMRGGRGRYALLASRLAIELLTCTKTASTA